MSLVVLVPLESGLDSIEKPRFPGTITVAPIIVGRSRREVEAFVQISKFFLTLVRAKVAFLPLGFFAIDGFCLQIGSRRS